MVVWDFLKLTLFQKYFLAKYSSKLALVWIDSKITKMPADKKEIAARNVSLYRIRNIWCKN